MNIVKKFQKKRGVPQVQINFDHNGAQGLVLVAKDGWDKTKWEHRDAAGTDYPYAYHDTRGNQIRFSINASLWLTYEEWRELVTAVEKSYREVLDAPVGV